MFVTNWISTTKIQKISEITNFFRHYFLSRTEVSFKQVAHLPKVLSQIPHRPIDITSQMLIASAIKQASAIPLYPA